MPLSEDFVDDRVRMQQEYDAWQNFIAEWKKLFPGIDLNDSKYTPLVKSVEVWGEFLVTLRLRQSAVVRATILNEKVAAYQAVKS